MLLCPVKRVNIKWICCSLTFVVDIMFFVHQNGKWFLIIDIYATLKKRKKQNKHIYIKQGIFVNSITSWSEWMILDFKVVCLCQLEIVTIDFINIIASFARRKVFLSSKKNNEKFRKQSTNENRNVFILTLSRKKDAYYQYYRIPYV